MANNDHENRDLTCNKHLGQKLMYFMIGGGIGAAIALLFAPKRGSELRGDIADMANKSYEETLASASRLKHQAAQYYEAAKETGSEVLDVVAEGASAVKEEVRKDVGKIGAIVEDRAMRAV